MVGGFTEKALKCNANQYSLCKPNTFMQHQSATLYECRQYVDTER
jgi:hypothetical protein